MHLADAVNQAGGAGLKDDRRFDLEDPIGLDRGHLAPAWTAGDRRFAYPLAAPGREDHVRIAPQDFLSVDHAVLRQARSRELGENGCSTSDLDELLDPADAGNQRLVPLFEEHLWP